MFRIASSKAALIKKAIGADALPIERTEKTLKFPWFSSGASGEEVAAYSHFVNIEFLSDPENVVERNKEKIAGITDFYSIKAGMPLCTQADTDIIFAPVTPYTVEYDGNILQSSLAMNKAYHNFDNWNITRADGTPVSKKSVKREIEKIKIKDIESNWSTKYENRWVSEVSSIEAAVLSAPNGSIQAFNQEYLMKFFTALDWRGFKSNQQFGNIFNALCNGILDDVDIPETNRVLPSLKTAADEMRHYLLLQYYRKYLNDTGVIYQDAMANLRHTNFHFLVADGSNTFITSDSPAFTYKRNDGKLVGLLPITPKILMAKGKCSDGNALYFVTHIRDDAVKRYNNAIRSNADEFVVIQ